MSVASGKRRFLQDLVELGCGQRVVWKAENPKVPSWTGVQLHKNQYGDVVVLFDHLQSPSTVAERDLIQVSPASPGSRVADALDCSSAIARIDPFEPHPDV
jgi:hypothetical protein